MRTNGKAHKTDPIVVACKIRDRAMVHDPKYRHAVGSPGDDMRASAGNIDAHDVVAVPREAGDVSKASGEYGDATPAAESCDVLRAFSTASGPSALLAPSQGGVIDFVKKGVYGIDMDHGVTSADIQGFVWQHKLSNTRSALGADDVSAGK